MAIKLNHTIVWSRDRHASATFLTEILGLRPPVRFGPFLGVEVANEVTLDFGEASTEIQPQHYAFLIDEAEFDAIFKRIKERDVPYWADPFLHQPGEINRHDGGRGVYFKDPSGHILEIITRPYGSGG
jgi:catechol 2,3-dioxygenase-like lactoylglutathione lyase family enzyme